MDALIEAYGLSKKFGKVTALSDLSLELPAGQPVAILGPNGAGKTTFIRMVATLIRPDTGGHPPVLPPACSLTGITPGSTPSELVPATDLFGFVVVSCLSQPK